VVARAVYAKFETSILHSVPEPSPRRQVFLPQRRAVYTPITARVDRRQRLKASAEPPLIDPQSPQFTVRLPHFFYQSKQSLPIESCSIVASRPPNSNPAARLDHVIRRKRALKSRPKCATIAVVFQT
jgi:hypothetical protein